MFTACLWCRLQTPQAPQACRTSESRISLSETPLKCCGTMEQTLSFMDCLPFSFALHCQKLSNYFISGRLGFLGWLWHLGWFWCHYLRCANHIESTHDQHKKFLGWTICFYISLNFQNFRLMTVLILSPDNVFPTWAGAAAAVVVSMGSALPSFGLYQHDKNALCGAARLQSFCHPKLLRKHL